MNSDTSVTATHELWAKLRRPMDFAEAIGTLFGLGREQATSIEALILASSIEAQVLLAAMPTISRSLASIFEHHAVHCHGEIRGPILWGETVAAQGASGGHQDVMVCAVPARSHDCDENQLLITSLSLIAKLTPEIVNRTNLVSELQPGLVDTALENGAAARHFLEDSRLIKLRRRRLGLREIQRIRFGPLGRVYEPARLMYELGAQGPSLESAISLVGDESIEFHEKIMKLVGQLEAQGGVVRPFRARDGELTSGAIEFRHPALWQDSDWYGIRYQGAVIDADVYGPVPSKSAYEDEGFRE